MCEFLQQQQQQRNPDKEKNFFVQAIRQGARSIGRVRREPSSCRHLVRAHSRVDLGDRPIYHHLVMRVRDLISLLSPDVNLVKIYES